MPFRKPAATAVPAPQTSAPCEPVGAANLVRAMIDAATPMERARLLGRLVDLASGEAVDALASLLSHGDPAVRADGIDGLRRSDRSLRLPVLARLLADPSPDMRIRALDAFERLPDSEVEQMLIALLGREREANVCGVVLDLLVEVGSCEALPAIREARLRFANEPFIAFAADIAISQILEG